jgi:hypothetical protein
MIGGLIFLVAQSTVGVLLKFVAHPVLRRPLATVQRKPEEEFHFRWDQHSSNLLGAEQRRHPNEECPVC